MSALAMSSPQRGDRNSPSLPPYSPEKSAFGADVTAHNFVPSSALELLKPRSPQRMADYALSIYDYNVQHETIREVEAAPEKMTDGNHKRTFVNGDWYEGEWKNGLMHGYGTFTSQKHQSRYEGMWACGLHHGYGITSDAHSITTYSGNWERGKRHGHGTLEEQGGLYSGSFCDNALHGYGVFHFSNGSKYKGDFTNNEFTGKGIFINADGDRIDGKWVNGVQDGQPCRVIYANGHVYQGTLRDNMKDGSGSFSSPGFSYCGEWKHDKMHGFGTGVYEAEAVYKGEWADGLEHGNGWFDYFALGAKYDGEMRQGQRSGKGVYQNKKGEVYVGEWLNNEMHGHGEKTFANGGSYSGEWACGKMNGKGTFVSESGKKYLVQHSDGNLVNKIVIAEGTPRSRQLKHQGASPNVVVTPRGEPQEQPSVPADPGRPPLSAFPPWLDSISSLPSDCKEILMKERVDEVSLLLLTEDDLVKLSFPLGPRRILMAHIAKQSSEEATGYLRWSSKAFVSLSTFEFLSVGAALAVVAVMFHRKLLAKR